MTKFKSTDVAVVGYGGIFPGAKNPTQFFDNLMAKKRAMADITVPQPEGATLFNLTEFYDPDPSKPDRYYSRYAAYVDRRIIHELVGDPKDPKAAQTSMEVLGLEAANQALKPLMGRVDFSKAEIMLGCGSPDGGIRPYLQIDQVTRILRAARPNLTPSEISYVEESMDKAIGDRNFEIPKFKYVLTTSFLHMLKRTFGIKGHASLIDAACGSSLAAIYVAMARLQSGETELVVTGGTELSATPLTLVLFSKAGMLSPGLSSPFDQDTDGANLGEAVVMYALMRVEDARKKGLKIFGVIEGCAGSCDGRSGGIMEPTMEGQALAYTRAYGEKEIPQLDYVEAHGTGTKVGDPAELRSLARFFPKPTLMGSAKANVGHAMGAAGAVSVVKCLEIIKNKKVPPVPSYFRKLPTNIETHHYVNTEAVDLSKINHSLRMGISSFGFGGTNYHLSLSEMTDDAQIVENPFLAKTPCLISGSTTVFLDDVPKLIKHSTHRIPPKSLQQIDQCQLAALLGTELLFKKLGINTRMINGNDVAVISASVLMLDAMSRHREYGSYLALKIGWEKEPDTPAKAKIISLIQEQLNSLPAITEDSGSALPNIIAGRVSKAYNFKGVSFNVDCDLASKQAAMMYAQQIIDRSGGAVLVLSCLENYDEEKGVMSRKGMECTLLSGEKYAFDNNLPVSGVLSEVSYAE